MPCHCVSLNVGQDAISNKQELKEHFISVTRNILPIYAVKMHVFGMQSTLNAPNQNGIFFCCNG